MTKDDNWEPTTERFVAFFDIMGFKDLVQKKKHEEILDLLTVLSENRLNLGKANNRETKSGNGKFGETTSFTFSDSIMFFSKGSKKEDLSKIILDCHFILKIALEHQIPIKGAIAYGKITINEKSSIYFGQPIIDAVLLHDELHLYSVIADNSFEKRINELNVNAFLKEHFEFYKTPLKSGKANHHILKPLPKDCESFLNNLNTLYTTISGKPRQYIDNSIEFMDTLGIAAKNPQA